jgi:hypothetical protein
MEELEYIENKEAEAKHKHIAEQFAEIICSGSPSLGRMEVQES